MPQSQLQFTLATPSLKGLALSTIDLVEAAAEVAVFSLLGLLQGLLLWAVDGVVAAFSLTLIDLAIHFTASRFKITEIADFQQKVER